MTRTDGTKPAATYHQYLREGHTPEQAYQLTYHSNTTTQTGIPIAQCDECRQTHPITRKRHCPSCGIASLFLDHNGNCINCTYHPERNNK